MRPDMTGVLVSKINPLSDAHKVLRKDDIVLAFDGIPIANDGTGSSIELIIFLFNFNFYYLPFTCVSCELSLIEYATFCGSLVW